MGWVKLDDAFHAHPKVLAAGLEATGLFVMSLSYSASYLTDGVLTNQWVQMTAGKRWKELSDRLIEVGLWNPLPEGFQVHDYADWNFTRAQVLDRRRKDSARKATG